MAFIDFICLMCSFRVASRTMMVNEMIESPKLLNRMA